VVIGIGGSYLGTRAGVRSSFTFFPFLKKDRKHPVILYAGQNLGEDYLNELLENIEPMSDRHHCDIKVGNHYGTAIAFRILKNHLEHKVGKKAAKELIIAITDARKEPCAPWQTTKITRLILY